MTTSRVIAKAMFVSLAVMAALLSAAAAAAAEPPAETKVIKLTYTPCTGQEMLLSTVPCALDTTKPEGLTAEPAYKGKPLYGSLHLGAEGKPFLVALDPSAADGMIQGTLYVDRDRDGDLAKEKPLALAGGGVDFDLAIVVGDKTVNRLFTASALPKGESAAILILRERGAWKAKADVGGQTLDIMAVDGNSNGRFNDAFVLPEPGKPMPPIAPDMILTKPLGPAPDLSGMCVCPVMMALGGALYDVDVAADGTSVTFAPHAGPTAALTAPDGLTAILSVGGRMLTVTARDGKMLVPAGTIRPFVYGFSKKDANGALWTLTSGPDTKPAPIQLSAGGVAAFPAGLPLVATVKASVGAAAKLAPGQEVSFSVTTTDAAGNDVNLQQVPAQDAPRTGPDEPTPTVIVIKQGDKTLHRGKCGFG